MSITPTPHRPSSDVGSSRGARDPTGCGSAARGRRTSHLPGRPYPVGTAVFPDRDRVVASGDTIPGGGIEQLLGTTVTAGGPRRNVLAGRHLGGGPGGTDGSSSPPVLNTRPSYPNWPGLDGFDGAVLHSSACHSAEPFGTGACWWSARGVVGRKSSTTWHASAASTGGVAGKSHPSEHHAARLPGGIPVGLSGHTAVRCAPRWSIRWRSSAEDHRR